MDQTPLSSSPTLPTERDDDDDADDVCGYCPRSACLTETDGPDWTNYWNVGAIDRARPGETAASLSAGPAVWYALGSRRAD